MGFLTALAYSLLMNAIPLVEVIVNGRSPAVLLLLYWFETVLLLVTGAMRIVAHRRATGLTGHHVPIATVADPKAGVEATRRSLGNENTYLRGFLGITVVFTLAHGLFVLLLVFLFKIAGPVSFADARIALVYAICVQALFLLWDLRRLPAWTFAQLSANVGTVSIRVLVTQLGLIFGFPVTGMTGSPWGLVGTFIGLRAFADAGIAWLQALMKRKDLPPGLARVFSRTSKQSVEALEAEFDALKESAKGVEALLEAPIAEARRRSGAQVTRARGRR
ncbi:MAG TPA: DUF6498-containing protein [Casimicrobiaceae bacterium]|nr:DUF6498-containing protein [Casimicrobiaceae bacterium]